MGTIVRDGVIYGGGGGSTPDIKLVHFTINYDETVLDKVITLTNGEESKSFTADSSGVAHIDCKNLGTWTIICEDKSETFNTRYYGAYTLEFSLGFTYRTWLKLGGVSGEFDSLASVLADQLTVRILMTKHASADYLVENWSEVEADMLASEYAMKWIGLRDYVCDKLMALDGVTAKMLATDFWEYILKDHVPVMTSNTAPYGTASCINSRSGAEAYRAFIENAIVEGTVTNRWIQNTTTAEGWIKYTFVNPICVKRVIFTPVYNSGNATIKTFKIQASNDGNTWIDLYSGVHENVNSSECCDIDNENYYTQYRLYADSDSYAGVNGVNYLQFYGRALNVSVPTMTSNTAPWGEVIGDNKYDSAHDFFCAFDNDSSTYWSTSASISLPHYLGYKFNKKVCVKSFAISSYHGTNSRTKDFKIQGSNDGTSWTDIQSFTAENTGSTHSLLSFTLDNSNSYQYYRAYITSSYDSGINTSSIITLQFYGVDYSEREFEEGSTMKYIYDHGVEFVQLSDDNEYRTREEGCLYCINGGSNYNGFYFTQGSIDFSKYNIERKVIGDRYYECSFIGVASSNTPACGSTNWTAGSAVNTFLDPNNDAFVDVSSISDSEFAFVGTGGGTGRLCAITEWWLE